MKDLRRRARVVVRTSNLKISRFPLADYVKKMHQKACRTCSTIIFPHSTNHIIDLGRCRRLWRRHFLNSPLYDTANNWFRVTSGLNVKAQNFLTWLCWHVMAYLKRTFIKHNNSIMVKHQFAVTPIAWQSWDMYYRLWYTFVPLTSTEKTQLLLSPAESVTSYLM